MSLTHIIYPCMVQAQCSGHTSQLSGLSVQECGINGVKRGRREGNVLFNKALLRLFSLRLMVKDHSDCERKPSATTSWVTLSDYLS